MLGAAGVGVKPVDPKAPAVDPKADPKVAPGTELELKLPDGFDAKNETLTAFKGLAKELNLPVEHAQKVFDLYAGAEKARTEKLLAEFDEGHAAAIKAVETDKEIGGDKLKETLDLAGRWMNKFASPELRKRLTDSGMGDDVEMLRAIAKAARAMSDDTIGTPPAKASDAKNDRERFLADMYPNSQPPAQN